MLRVLIVEPAGNLWGSERVLVDFLYNANYTKHEILICCPPGSPILSVLEGIPVQISATFGANLHKRNRFARLRSTFRLMLTAMKFSPDLIYVNQAGATRISLFVGQMLHIPVIPHIRMAQDVEYIISLKDKTEKLPGIICISNYVRDLFLKSSNINNQLITLYDSYTPQKLSEDLNDIEEKELSLINVGRVTPTKGQDIFLKAIACLQQQGLNVKAFILGNVDDNDDFEKYLQKLTFDMNIAQQVSWLGFHDEVLDQMHNKSALILTSYNEALGRVIFEAWDAGTIPVVWKGAGGSSEIIRASGGGFLYEEQTGESLAETIKMISALSHFERAEILKKGRHWLLNNCNPTEYALRLQHIWQTVAKS